MIKDSIEINKEKQLDNPIKYYIECDSVYAKLIEKYRTANDETKQIVHDILNVYKNNK